MNVEKRRDPNECPQCGFRAEGPTRRALQFALIAVTAIAIGIALGASDVAFFAVVAIGVYLLITDRWRCPECGASWN